MKKLLFILPVALIVLTACPRKKDNLPDSPGSTVVPIVSQFAYDGMSLYYLWADQMQNKKPTSAAKDPKAYFQTLLSDIDKKHRWSGITDNVDALLAGFSGTPTDFGWSLNFFLAQTAGQYVAIVKYVFPNTPASAANIIRGNIIDKIDGAAITANNYTKLFGSAPVSISVFDENYANGRTLSLTPVQITTNPILKDTLYETNGRKIAYLFYTGFIDDFNNQLYNTFADFKANGATDLIIDLRYNHGGAISAASYLASLFAPQPVVKNKSVFTILDYNSSLNAYFDQQGWQRRNLLGAFKANGTNPEQDPLNANLNMSKVYIIATDDSYSASELITFCLKPYMEVVHVGDSTGGKFTGSWTLHAFDDKNERAITVYDAAKVSAADKNALKNWAMQPIVAIYKDKNGADFSGVGKLVPTVPVATQENAPASYKPIGDTRDYLLAKTISLITGVPVSGIASTVPRSAYPLRVRSFTSESDRRSRQSVRLEKPENFSFSKLAAYMRESN